MKTKANWRWLNLAIVVAMLLVLVPAGSIGAMETAPVSENSVQLAPPQQEPPEPKRAPVPPSKPTDSENAMEKLHPDLQELALAASPALPAEVGAQAAVPQEAILVHIIASVDIKPGMKQSAFVGRIEPYFVDGKLYAQPILNKGENRAQQILAGLILPENLLKVASFGNVLAIYPMTIERAEYEGYPPDDTVARPGPKDWGELRANADKLRGQDIPWSQAKAFGDGRDRPSTKDWFEVLPEGPHKAQAAWARGYMGEGVAVAVIDDGVDMGHPDLMGTQKIYSSTVAPQYNGWPMAMDPFTMRAYFNELYFGSPTYVSESFGGVTYIDTSETPALSPCGIGLSCFSYTPWIDYGALGYNHTYVISDTMTQSGVVHVGTHVDESLRDYVWGEKVAVLVCDPNTAGVYDTVYVDLDDDYDFRDEKPVTKADVNDLANTKNNPISYRDMNADGLADLSGGMLYFIADGVNYVPGFDWLYYPAATGIDPPDSGDLIAMHGPWDSGYSHGTNCASNVVAQGVVSGMLPEFRDLVKGTAGKPAGAVYGAAPEADFVPMNNAWVYTGRINYRDAYMLAAIGWDGVDQYGDHWFYGSGYEDTDLIVATSNSYGWSADFNDGYDYLGQFIVQVQRLFAPYQQYLFSTGNGGPGYGTVTPPSPGLGIAVGASTEYGSTGWDTITDTNQIMFNDIAAFSNSGPGARDGAGVDVVAGGAYAAGSEELNYYSPAMYGVLDGNLSWDDWGGTSRSAPVVLGNLALVYQAYKAKHGVWPTHEEAKAILMSSATDLNYDVFKQGAGSVNADRGTAVAGGHEGVYMGFDSATWEPGDYRGVNYPGFAHIVYPGDTFTKTFSVLNDTTSAISVTVSDAYLELIEAEEFDFTVTAAMVEDEEDNFYKAFNYFIPITATAGMDASWYNIEVPADTELMVVRQAFPFDEYDYDGDYAWDNRFYLMVYNWKDVDDDGLVWDDKDANGVVDFVNATTDSGLKSSPELEWDDPITELDRWEYGRFGYNRPEGNTNELMVHDPLDRMHDGLFIGLRHHPGSSYTGDTHLQYRIEFYKKVDVPWLSTDAPTPVTVPADGKATFVGTVNVPGDMPPGDYEAAIEILDGDNNIVIPVALNVAADFDGDVTLAGMEAYTYDADKPYNNGAVRGYFDWGWREESGDWRFFYMDIDNEPVATVLFEEDFEGSFPPTGWSVITNTGAGWNTNTYWGAPNRTNGSGQCADADSDAFGGGMDTELWSPMIDLTGLSHPELTYESNFQDYVGNGDAWLDISTDSGATWTSLTWWTEDHGPTSETVDLSAYVSEMVILRWHFVTPGWDWYWQIDDVSIADTDYPIPPDSHVILRDEWDDVAPHTDIDTIVLGPTPTSLNAADFGVWGADFSDPGFFGNYVLDTVVESADDRAGQSIWRFNTTSGANEEWLMFPIQDGLHEIMQHNVLFEGDMFDVVFTKTVGLLMEDPHGLAVDTYLDEGELGKVTLESTIGLNGLEASGYLSLVDEYSWVNEPISFISSSTIEWTYVFEVQDGVSIEAWTSSADIPDLDLYLYYFDGTTWVQRGSSTGADANEYILLQNPEDGDWFVGINNWSGPAGTFNLDLVVSSRGTGISVTGLPTGAVAANTPVTLTVLYDREMTPGVCYDGVVNVGPPEAPELKEIPLEICRLQESAMIEKEVEYETVFPETEFDYTIDLYNLSDVTAHFTFTDRIPDNTEFVTVTGATYDPVLDQVVYTGTLPLGALPPNNEGFEGGLVPPVGWTHVQNNANETWYSTSADAHSGSYSAQCDYDAALNQQDEWLISPYISGLTGGENVTAWSMGSYYWAVDPEDNYDINAWLVVDDLGGGDDVLLGKCDDDWTASWTWAQSTFTLPTTLPAGDLSVGFQYYGADGAQANIDDIVLPGTLAPLPSMSVEVTVRVTDTVTAEAITNTASLEATHYMAYGEQMETAEASAVSYLAQGPDFSTSYKTATVLAEPGDVIEYEVHVINTGDTLVEVTFTDPIPTNTTYDWHLSPPPSSYEYDAVDDQMEWTGNVAPLEEIVSVQGGYHNL